MSGEPAHAFPPEGPPRPTAIPASERGLVDRALHLAALREHSLLSLSELSQNLSGSPDLFHMADLVLFNLMGQFGTPRSALWLLSKTDRSAVLLRAHGISRPIAQATGNACAATLAKIDPGNLQAVPCDRIGASFGEAAQLMAEHGRVAAIAPIPGREETLGLIALGARIGGMEYGTLELKSLQAACSVLGVAIQNLNLVSRMADKNRELRRANDELREIDRLKTELLSNVSHELCTPLSVIIGYMESLLDTGVSHDRERDILRVVMGEARKLNGKLGGLLTLSASSQGRLALEINTGDVGACVDAYCEEHLALVNSQLREFVWSVEPGLPPACFDRARLLQVLEALVDNATKFTPQGTKVQVSVRQAASGAAGVAIEVSDEGPGIPKEQLPHIFESFRQGDGSTTRTIGGMGIGLSFSRQLVEAMGGRIEVRSEPGRGSAFTVTLATAGASSRV